MTICPQCEGKGKIEKPVSMTRTELVVCDMCEGTGHLEDAYEDEVIKRLDRIIELLTQINRR